MKKNKSVIVLISVILILSITGGVFAYLYLVTDMFKSERELFAKYFGQNEIIIEKLANLKVIDSYKNLENENKYESSTNIKMNYSEGGEISNPLNDLSVKFDVQKENDEYAYVNAQILYENEEYLQAELIRKQNIYGVRFTDAFQQFITVEKDENFNEIMEDIGVDIEQIDAFINTLEKQKNNNYEDIKVLKNKYLNIISSGIANGEFSKQKNALITYNNNSINTNAYTVFLNNQQIENILIEILNNIKNETEILEKLNNKDDVINNIDEVINKLNKNSEIPEVKITAYEYEKKLIRTVFGIGENSIIIENDEQNQGIKTKIKYSNLNEEKPIHTEIDISKISSANNEKIEIITDITEGEEKYSIILSNLIEVLQNQIQITTKLECKQDITSVSINIDNKISIGQEFENVQTLDKQNSKLINSVKSEKRKDLINQIENLVAQKITERIVKLNENMNNSENIEKEDEISQVEINKFNAKFEFYTGEEVSAENVKSLLEVVKNNIGSYEFLNDEESENDSNNIAEKINVKLNIEKDKTNEEGIQKVLEKINMNKKYKVSIKYNDINGLISYITITEIQ